MNKLTRFDSAEYLETEEDITAYLDAIIQESDDPAVLIRALGVIARARNFSELARKTGVSREGLYKALSEDGNPSFATILKMIAAFGLQIKFVPATPLKLKKATKIKL